MGRPYIVLASASPRRRELLGELCGGFGVPVVVAPIETDESFEKVRQGLAPVDRVRALSLAKALARLSAGLPAPPAGSARADAVVLTADTVVIAPSGAFLAKAGDAAEADRLLRLLDGVWHRVVTAVTLARPEGKIVTLAEESEVRLGPLSEAERAEYVATGLWRGKAGAYGIQDAGTSVRALRGSRTNVIGLPMEALVGPLAALGIHAESGHEAR